MKKKKEEIKESSKIKNLAYKVKYEDDLFKFGFGEVINDSSEVKIRAEFELTKDEFKVYFSSILSSIVAYNEKTGKNIFEEIFDKEE